MKKTFLMAILLTASLIPFNSFAQELQRIDLDDNTCAVINYAYDTANTANFGTGIYIYEKLSGIEIQRYPHFSEIVCIIDKLANSKDKKDNNLALLITARVYAFFEDQKKSKPDIQKRADKLLKDLDQEAEKHP